MKRIKELMKNVKGVILASTKLKIIAGSIAGLVVVGGGVGTYVYVQSQSSLAGQGKVDESLVHKEDSKLTDEEKAYDDKVIKLNSIVDAIKELDPEFKYEEEVSKDNVDELTKKYSSKRQELLAKKEEEKKKDEEEKPKDEENKEEVAQGGSSSGKFWW